MKYLICTAFLLFSSLLPLRAVTIGENWVIHCRKDATVTEQYAAETLQKYIAVSTGMKLKITSELSSPAVRIACDDKLKPEEHLVKALPDGDLLVSGGNPSGVIYGAFEFLEKIAGCRFLAPDEEYVPRLKELSFDDRLLLRGEPAFLRRQISPGPGVRGHLKDYLTKLRYSGFTVKGVYVNPYRSGGGHGHSFYLLSRNFPKNKPEYFSLDNTGKRQRPVNGIGPGQLCLTHPDVRALMAKNLNRLIDRMVRKHNAAPAEKRQAPPYVYHVAKNDNRNDCVCPGCRKEVERYNGNHAGLMKDFVSDIAGRVGKVHPDVLLAFLGYTTDECPVKGYKLPPNVMVVTAQLGSEWSSDVNRDSMRSLHHPLNSKAKKRLQEWRQVTDHLGSWDYWVLFRQHYGAPVTNVSALIDNIRFYAGIKMEKVYAETKIKFENLLSFIDLRHYAVSKVMQDPACDERAVIDEFMRLYYGKAAPAMTGYLNYLEKRMQEEPVQFGLIAPGGRRYLDKAFYYQAEKFLAEAEKAVAGSQKHLRRIGQERIMVDQWILNEYKNLGLSVNVKKIVERLRKNHRLCAAKYTDGKHAEKWIADAEAFIKTCVDAPPLPKEFSGKKYFDFWGPKLRPHGTRDKRVDDPDSPAGSARMLGPIKKDFHKKPLELAVYDKVNRKYLLRKSVSGKDYPQDEKYHWYKVGKTHLTVKTQLIFHSSWSLSQSCGNDVYDPLEPDAEYEIYASIKLTGPSYVKNSRKPDGVYLDRVVFLECSRTE